TKPKSIFYKFSLCNLHHRSSYLFSPTKVSFFCPKLDMDAATASLIRSPLLPHEASRNGAGPMFLTASGPGFTPSGSRLQLRLRVRPESVTLHSDNPTLVFNFILQTNLISHNRSV